MRLVKIIFLCAAFAIFAYSGVQAAGGQQAAAEGKSTVIKVLEPKEAEGLIKTNKDNPNFVILDVRTPEEFQSGHIEGAINIDYNSKGFEADLEKLDKAKTYLVYCKTGRRSGDSANIMLRLGFKNILRIAGDIVRWKKERLPVVK